MPIINKKNINTKKPFSGNIPEKFLNELKLIPMNEVADKLGIILERDYHGNCPTGHKSENGRCFSLNLNINKKNPHYTYYCFSCEISGNNIQLVQLIKGFEFREACKWLADNFKVKGSKKSKCDPLPIAQKADESLQELYEVNKYIAEYYQKKLKKEPAAIDYLKTRGFTEEEIFDTRYYFLGYAPKKNRKLFTKVVDKFGIKAALSAGLFRCEELEEEPEKDINSIDVSRVKNVFFGVITVGYVENEQVKYFCRRSINKDARPKIIKAKTKERCHYSKAENIIFGADSITIDSINFRNSLIITEGLFDATSLIKRDIPCVSPITVGFSEEQLPRLRALVRDKTVYICQDTERSQAGIKGSLKTAKEIIGIAAEIRIVILPLPLDADEGKIDVNDYFEKYGHTTEEFQELLSRSLSLTDYYIQQERQHLKEFAESLIDIIDYKSNITLGELQEQFKALSLVAVLNSLDYVEQYDVLNTIRKKYFKKSKKKFKNFIKAIGILQKSAAEYIDDFENTAELEQIIFKIRNDKKKTTIFKNQKIKNLLLKDLKSRGKFYVDENDTPYFFDISEKVLLELDFSDPKYLHFLGKRGLTKEETSTKIINQHIRNYCREQGQKVEIRKDWYYDCEKFTLYIDLRNKKNRLIKITSEEIETVDNGIDGVMFLSSKYEPLEIDLSLIPEIEALSKHKNDYLRTLIIDTVNFDDDSQLSIEERKLLLWLYYHSLFFTSKTIFRNKPLLLLYGEKGSGKTLLIQFIGKLLFGEVWDMETITNDNQNEIEMITTHRSFIGLDNCDSRIRWIEDFLCSISTGKTITKRVLYTTNEERIYQINSFLALTARTPKFRRDDVADRLLILKLKRFDTMTPASEIFKKIKQYKVKLLTETVFNLQKILQRLKKYEGNTSISNFRQGDFVNFCYKVLDCQDFILQVFQKMETEQLEYAAEFEPLTGIIEEWLQDMEGNSSRYLTAKELYDELKELCLDKSFDFYYKSPMALAKKIQAVKKVLELQLNITIVKKKDRLTYNFRMKNIDSFKENNIDTEDEIFDGDIF